MFWLGVPARRFRGSVPCCGCLSMLHWFFLDPLHYLVLLCLCLVLHSFLGRQLMWSFSPLTPGSNSGFCGLDKSISCKSPRPVTLGIFLSSLAGTFRVVTLGQDTRKFPFFWDTGIMENLCNFSCQLQFLSHVAFWNPGQFCH